MDIEDIQQAIKEKNGFCPVRFENDSFIVKVPA